MFKEILFALPLIGALGLSAHAQTEVAPNTTIGGEAFLDVSHINNQQNGSDVNPTGVGFDAKRFYLVAEHQFDDVWSANITTDAQFSSSTTAGSGGVTEVFIKKLYLQAKLDDALVVHAGAYTSPWAPFVEGLYGYRYIEKTQTDRLGFGNTSDWGLNATGKIADSLLTYSASVVNGGGHKNPTRTKDVDFEARVGIVPVTGLTLALGVYSGHLGQVTQANANFASNTASRFDAAIGYKFEGFRIGGEYFTAKNYKSTNAAGILAGPAGVVVATNGVVTNGVTTSPGTVVSDKATGESIWVSYSFSELLSIFARYDNAKLSKEVNPDLKDTYAHIGVAYKPNKKLDLALVYKNEKVENGAIGVSSADANGTYIIGGSNATNSGKFSEIGVYAHYAF